MHGTSLKLVIFDCDGTLVDSQQAIVSAMTAAWRAAGLADPDAQAVRRVVSLPLTEAIALLVPGEEEWFVKRLAGLYRDAYYRERHQAEIEPEPLVPGMRIMLAALHAHGIRLGIATGKSLRGLAAVLEAHGIRDWFVTLQTADRAIGKPDPDMVFRAQQECGIGAADTVVVGDSTYDMEMAKAAGVPSIGVAWGYHEPGELEAAGARRIVHDCDELCAALMDVLSIRGAWT